MRTMLAVLMGGVLVVTACGGADNTPANDSHADGHGHDHAAPIGHVMGQFKLGDGYFMQASHEGAAEAGGTLKFEIVMKKDDKRIPGATIKVYASTKDGERLSDVVTGEWQGEKEVYNCTLELPDDLPKTAKITFEANVDGKDFKRSVQTTGHDHQ